MMPALKTQSKINKAVNPKNKKSLERKTRPKDVPDRVRTAAARKNKPPVNHTSTALDGDIFSPNGSVHARMVPPVTDPSGREPSAKQLAARAKFAERSRDPTLNKGKPPGTANSIPGIIKDAAVLAAAMVGFDGHGQDGLVGYLRRVAILEPVAYLGLLNRILPMQITDGGGNSPVFDAKMTPQEIVERLTARGLPIPPSLAASVPTYDSGEAGDEDDADDGQ